MTIKSLLLGSAAALSVVSGAHAADAIVAAEPEPLEYVRICDTYGAGYFYIPGSETCMRVGGLVRTEGKWYDAYNPTNRYGTLWHSRFDLNVATASDTELGALKTFATARFDWQEGATSNVSLPYAYISLGGFLVGNQDSQFSIFPGNAGNVISDDVVSYGPQPKNQSQLTYIYNGGGKGFSAVISLEDSKSGAGTTGLNGEKSANHYAPNVVAGVLYKDASWGVSLIGGYDSIVEEGAIKARVDADFGVFKAFLMGGWNTDGDKQNVYAPAKTAGVCTSAKVPAAQCGWGDWAVWTGVSVPFNKTSSVNAQVAYTDSKMLAVAANVQWYPVKSFFVEPEIEYTKWDAVDKSQWAGILRFQRTF